MRPTPTARSSRPGLLAAAIEAPTPATAQARRTDDVAFSMRALEPWASWAIAGYTALLAMGAPQSESLWAFVLYAGLVGKWAELNPARRQPQLFGRALVLLAGAFLLSGPAGADSNSGADAYFVWLAVTTLAYGFMLRPAWGWSVLATAVTIYLLPRIGQSSPEAWAVMLAEIGFLCIATPLLAMRFGTAMRRNAQVLDEQLTDGTTGLFNRAGLLLRGDELADAARRDRQPVTLALFDCADLGAIYREQGRVAGHQARTLWIRRLGRLAGGRGMVGRTGPTEFAVLLPGLGAEKAQRLILRELGSLDEVELDSDDLVLKPQLLLRELERGTSLAGM